MLNYSWKKYLLSIAIIGLIIFLVNRFKGSNEEFVCSKYNSFKHLEINGVVKEKLIDKNDHDNRIVIYADRKGDIRKINLSFDMSNLFTDVIAGDTILKEINSAEVKVNNRMYKIDYGVKCN